MELLPADVDEVAARIEEASWIIARATPAVEAFVDGHPAAAGCTSSGAGASSAAEVASAEDELLEQLGLARGLLVDAALRSYELWAAFGGSRAGASPGHPGTAQGAAHGVVEGVGDSVVLAEALVRDCRRIANLRAAVEAAPLSGAGAADPRVAGCLQACTSAEAVLADLGGPPAAAELHAALLRARAARTVRAAKAAEAASAATAADTSAARQEASVAGQQEAAACPDLLQGFVSFAPFCAAKDDDDAVAADGAATLGLPLRAPLRAPAGRRALARRHLQRIARPQGRGRTDTVAG